MTVATAALLLTAALQQAPAGSLVISPSELTIPVGETATVVVRADAGGAALDAAVLDWTALDDAIAAVSAAGVISGIAPGATRVTVRRGADIGFVSITVPELPAISIELSTVLADGIPLGGSSPMWAVGLNRLGETAPLGDVRWASSDPSVAAIDETGRVYGLRVGSARIRAEADGRSAEFPVEIRPTEAMPSLAPVRSRVRTGDVVRFTTGESWAPAWSVEGIGAEIRLEGTEGVFVAEEPGRYVVTARIGESLIRTALVDVEPREYDAELVVVGRGAIAEHHSGDMWVFEGVDGRDYMYVGTYMHDWMKVWDATDPANPILTDSLQFDARRINDIKIHPNNRLGIATREGASSRRNGIILLDLADPAHPTILSEYTETVTGGVHNVWIDGDRDLVYAAHNGTSSIHILDISDPAEVVEVGSWGLPKRTKTLHDVIIQDGYAYLSYWDDGILMLDVGAGTHGGTPTEPVEVSRYAYPVGNTHVAWRSGRYLFVGDEIFPPGWSADEAIHARGFIHVIDYIDPDNPVEVAQYEVPEAGVHNIWAEGDRLYLGYYQAGLRVLDISGELRGDLYAQGREVASILTTDGDTMVPNWPMTWGAQVFKGRIYTSDLNSGLWITRLIERRVVF